MTAGIICCDVHTCGHCGTKLFNADRVTSDLVRAATEARRVIVIVRSGAMPRAMMDDAVAALDAALEECEP